MIMPFVELAIVIVGFVAFAVVFFRIPKLSPKLADCETPLRVSVIIPARNEEHNLRLLLEDLGKQTYPLHEIICADDASEDQTAQIALDHGVKLICLKDKPEGWTGKTWACMNGAARAEGDFLLFLDADVRLGKEGIGRLMQTRQEVGCTVSVVPRHQPQKAYEQLSMLFNLMQIAANGTALPKARTIGLFGPLVLISKSDYESCGGHESVRQSVVEDIDLGHRMQQLGIRYRLFVGDGDISYRMYAGGLRGLLQGWIKNITSGAVRTPFLVFIAVFLWITSMTSVPLQWIKFAVAGDIGWLAAYTALYAAWAICLGLVAGQIGRFRVWTFALFPISVVFALGIFIVSLFRKIFRLRVTWKGRKI